MFKTTQKAVDSYQLEGEREALQMSVATYQLGKNTGSEEGKLGKDLFDRNSDNGDKWDIVVEKGNEDNPYGTDWNLIEEGTDLGGYGKAQNDWLVNYETGEIKELKDDGYDNWNYKSTVAIWDGLVFNLDSANVGLNEESWGKDTTLYYFDTQYDTMEKREQEYNKQVEFGSVAVKDAGYDRQKSADISQYLDDSTGAFKFNGNNYIEQYKENGYDFTDGLTFEFYGNIKGNVPTTVSPDYSPDGKSSGLFGLWTGIYNDMCTTRFRYYPNDLSYNLFWGTDYSEFGNTHSYGEWTRWINYAWNQAREIGEIYNQNIYFSVTLDNSKDLEEGKISQSIYIFLDEDNTKKITGWLDKEYYEKFIEVAKELHYLELGRCNFLEESNWCYLNGLCYSMKMYNKALTFEDSKANFVKARDFRKDVIEGNN